MTVVSCRVQHKVNCYQPWKNMKEVKQIRFLITRIDLVMENFKEVRNNNNKDYLDSHGFWAFFGMQMWSLVIGIGYLEDARVGQSSS